MTSPIRPDQNLAYALTVTRKAKSGTTFTKGRAVKATATEHEVDLSGAGEAICGIVLDDSVVGTGSNTVTIAIGNAIVPVLVGTGGATGGKYAEAAADGLTDRTVGGGTTLRHLAGMFTQTGVATDFVGLLVQLSDTVSN